MLCPYCNTDIPPIKNGKDCFNGVQRYECRICGRGFSDTYKTRAKPKNITVDLKNCLQCGAETENPKFCTSSCASAYNNHTFPVRAEKNQPKFCKKCNTPIKGRKIVCEDCNRNIIDYEKKTIADIQKAAKYQVSSQLRNIARRTYSKSGLPLDCLMYAATVAMISMWRFVISRRLKIFLLIHLLVWLMTCRI